MKILLLSVDPRISSGYGQISRRIVEIFNKIPEIDLKVMAYYGCKYPTEYSGVEILPTWGGFVGDKSVIYKCKQWKPDLLLTTFDLFIIDPDFFKQVKAEGTKIASMLMIDSSPYQHPNLYPLQLVDYPIVVTEQALDELPKDIASISTYIPLPLDPQYGVIKNEEARAYFNNLIGKEIICGDTQLVTVVSANVGDEHGRKNFYGIIYGWLEYLKKTGSKDKYLYLHTDVRGISAGGTDTKLMMMTAGYTPQQASTVIFPKQDLYLNNDITVTDLNNIYSASDIYLNPSQGEGFGMPIAESIACGCQPLVTDFGASREIIHKTQKFSNRHLLKGDPIYVGNNAVRCNVTPKTIAEGLDGLLNYNNVSRESLIELSSNLCLDEYGVDKNTELWRNLICRV